MKLYAAAAVVALAVSSACSKEPGEGGRAEVRGRVMEQRYNPSTNQPIGQPYPLAEARVYIIYGEGEFHDDDVRTGPDGRFRFPWLRKGDYTVYTMSECPDFDGCTFAVFAKATIGSRKEVVDVGDLNVQNW
jgi:hypothetical protein